LKVTAKAWDNEKLEDEEEGEWDFVETAWLGSITVCLFIYYYLGYCIASTLICMYPYSTVYIIISLRHFLTSAITAGEWSRKPVHLLKGFMRPSQLSSNLKQKLSTLSRQQSSPSTQSSPASAKTKFKNAISSAWRRHGPNQDIITQANYSELGGRETVQEVMSRLVFQAGVDFEWVQPGWYITRCWLLSLCKDKTNVRILPHFSSNQYVNL
jgi:hypothetical protein